MKNYLAILLIIILVAVWSVASMLFAHSAQFGNEITIVPSETPRPTETAKPPHSATPSPTATETFIPPPTRAMPTSTLALSYLPLVMRNAGGTPTPPTPPPPTSTPIPSRTPTPCCTPQAATKTPEP